MSRREQILDIAEELIEETGVDKFGVGELARALGVKPPSLYKHFAGIAEIEHALVSRGMRQLGSALSAASGLSEFCDIYRARALEAPQLYRLMTDRPLDRSLLDAGAEAAGMQGLLDLFGESVDDHPRARAAWAAAHGLVSLEIARRFPPGIEVQQSWDALIAAFSPPLSLCDDLRGS